MLNINSLPDNVFRYPAKLLTRVIEPLFAFSLESKTGSLK